MISKAYRNLRPIRFVGETFETVLEKINNLDIFLDYVVDPQVVAEVFQFRQARKENPALHARNVILFALLSPQTRFSSNVSAYHNLLELLESGPTPDHAQVRDAIYDVQFAINKANYVLEALPFLNDDRLHEKMTKKNLLALKGMGYKTTSFALALYDDLNPVFTLDLHMLRMIASVAGLGNDVNVDPPKGKVYNALEAAVVEWTQAREIESPFIAQWSLWNHWGFNRHVSHLPIIQKGE